MDHDGVMVTIETENGDAECLAKFMDAVKELIVAYSDDVVKRGAPTKYNLILERVEE